MPQKSTAALYLLEKLVGYGVIVLGVISGLSAAGLNLSSLALFARALGIGLGQSRAGRRARRALRLGHTLDPAPDRKGDPLAD